MGAGETQHWYNVWILTHTASDSCILGWCTLLSVHMQAGYRFSMAFTLLSIIYFCRMPSALLFVLQPKNSFSQPFQLSLFLSLFSVWRRTGDIQVMQKCLLMMRARKTNTGLEWLDAIKLNEQKWMIYLFLPTQKCSSMYSN